MKKLLITTVERSKGKWKWARRRYAIRIAVIDPDKPYSGGHRCYTGVIEVLTTSDDVCNNYGGGAYGYNNAIRQVEKSMLKIRKDENYKNLEIINTTGLEFIEKTED